MENMSDKFCFLVIEKKLLIVLVMKKGEEITVTIDSIEELPT